MVSRTPRVRTILVAALAVCMLVTLVPGTGANAADDVVGGVESRIVGGSPTADGEYPFQVAILVDKSIPGLGGLPTARPGWAQWCGGSVIDPDYILTAAHCFPGFFAEDFRVLAGTRDTQTGGDIIEIAEIIMHPDYTDPPATNDFALLRLARPVNESLVPLVRPGQAALWAAGTTSTVTGWGNTSSGGTGSRFLLGVDVPILTDTQCTNAYGSDYEAASMFCAGDLVDGGEDACQGDSGGPIFVPGSGLQELQVGVVSWGTGCADASHPGIYSRIANFYDWIKAEVGGEPNDNLAGAVAPACGVSTDTRSNQFATVEVSEPNGGVPGGGSLWWTFTAPEHGNLHINTLGSDFDTTLGLYSGSAVGSLSQLAFNDDISETERRSAIAGYHLLDNQTVRIRVDGYNPENRGPERGRARLNISFDTTTFGEPQFPDVSMGNPFVDEIAWMANEGITTGFGDCGFRPVGQVTRQSMAAFLYRYAGWDQGFFPAPGFNDVAGSHPFYKDIAWMVEEGITTGFPDGGFRPGDTVKRQSMAAFLYRLAGSPNGADPTCTSAPFPDVPTTHPFCGEIDWLADTGITGGFADGNFKPGNDITRQAMAAFLNAFDTV